jgi:ABC-2 type transport system permease protein
MMETIRAAFVIGRRDFTAIIFSKAFFFFLLGPLFPLLVGGVAGSLGGQVAQDIAKPVIGIAMTKEDSTKLVKAASDLKKQLGESRFPELKILADNGVAPDPEALIKDKANGLIAVVSGTPKSPILTGTGGPVEIWKGEIALLAAYADQNKAMAFPEIKTQLVRESAGNSKQLQLITAQMAQAMLFLLTMLLAGMVLSNLVEEKSNKIIEVLAASIPMDAVFLGKLFAMLAMAFVGIIVWSSVGFGLVFLSGANLPNFPAPAVGWPIFLILAIIYFAMAYLILGSMFLGIGAMAATVREVQTLSMPATMGQLIIFFVAMYSVPKINQPIETFASVFPFSSPFAMIARAAQDPTLWHHLIAIVGQGFFVMLILRIGVYLFRRNVMKSGSAGRIKHGSKRRLFGIIPMKDAAQ